MKNTTNTDEIKHDIARAVKCIIIRDAGINTTLEAALINKEITVDEIGQMFTESLRFRLS